MTAPATLVALALLAAPALAAAETAPAAPPATADASAPLPAPLPAPSPAHPPVRLAVETEAVLGVAPGEFYNHLAGGRLDFQFSPRVAFGGYLGYANLKGKDGRVHDVLVYGQVEYQLPTSSPSLRIPFRFASGYLPRNGPVVRMATGFAVALSPRVDFVSELLAPMFWLTSNQMLLSMNLSFEIAFRL